MNYAALRQRAAQLASQAGLDAVQPAPDWGSVINLALEEFSWNGEYVVTIDAVTLVQGTATYALPLGSSQAPWKRVTDAVLNGTQQMAETDPQLLRREDPNWIVGQQATPTRWWMPSPGNIAFYPTPAAPGTVTVRGYRGDGPLVSDTDSPACPAHFHEGVALIAAWRVCKQFAKESDEARVAAYRSEADDIIGQLAVYLAEANAPAFQRRVARERAERIPFGWMRWLP